MSDSFVTSRIIARQAPLSIEFPRQEYWSGTTIELSQWLRIKESACNTGYSGLIPGLGRGKISGGGHGNPLNILAGIIPWTEEPDRLQSMGSQRVRHD